MSAFLLLLVTCAPLAFSADSVLADTKKPPVTPAAAKKTPEPKPIKVQKTAEQRYVDGSACLKPEDTTCAQLELTALNPASPYAKLLQAQIAAATGDFDTALRLLLPLQTENNLIQLAHASLHATLGYAYAHQENPLRALEQYVKAAGFMDHGQQENIWQLVSGLPREVLLEMRGEGVDGEVQGWIDLAIAAGYAEHKSRNIEQWRSAYPTHPASDALLTKIITTATPVADKRTTPTVSSKIALLLPVQSPVYGKAAQAVLAGFMAAHGLEAEKPEVSVYATGTAEETQEAYKKAVYEGAQWVVGPLTRDEVAAVVARGISIPTLVLNQPEGDSQPQDKLMMLALSAEAEARQIARTVRRLGLQSAQIVLADTPLNHRIARAFTDEWKALDGTISTQLNIPASNKLGELKAAANAKPADMIFLAASAAQARQTRPYLDTATPTYGVAQIYDGESKSLQNLDLIAVRFVDMPWLLNPESPEFSALRAAATEFKSADLQRLFALGVDAYHLLPRLQDKTSGKVLLEGVTGKILYGQNGLLLREVPMAQFRREGIVLEAAP